MPRCLRSARRGRSYTCFRDPPRMRHHLLERLCILLHQLPAGARERRQPEKLPIHLRRSRQCIRFVPPWGRLTRSGDSLELSLCKQRLLVKQRIARQRHLAAFCTKRFNQLSARQTSHFLPAPEHELEVHPSNVRRRQERFKPEFLETLRQIRERLVSPRVSFFQVPQLHLRYRR